MDSPTNECMWVHAVCVLLVPNLGPFKNSDSGETEIKSKSNLPAGTWEISTVVHSLSHSSSSLDEDWSWRSHPPSHGVLFGRGIMVRGWQRWSLQPALMHVTTPLPVAQECLSDASMAHTWNWFINWERKLCRFPLYHLDGIVLIN